MKAAVLLVRLTKNHALPDGNKRTALAVTIAFCDVNGFDWVPPVGDDPDGEETYQLMLAIAAAPGADLGGRRSRGRGLDRRAAAPAQVRP
jgi:prophage maintenance system killer protein